MPLILTKLGSSEVLLEGLDETASVQLSIATEAKKGKVRTAPLSGHDTVAPVGVKRIKLGPRPGPPPPMAVRVETRLTGHSQDGPLNLREAFSGGSFSQDAISAIQRQLATAPGATIEAVVPPMYSIDLSLLALHVAHLRDLLGKDFVLTLGVDDEES